MRGVTARNIRVHSLVVPLHADDIRAVIAANPTVERICEIQVISSSEMRVYYQPISAGSGYAIAKRVNGKWRYIEKVAFTS